MSTRRPADTTPDLFSAHAPAKASEPPTAPQERAAAQPRHFLPKDLAGALKQLGNREIDALLSAVTTEAERRGRLSAQRSKEKFAADAKTQAHQGPVEAGAGSLTTGGLRQPAAPCRTRCRMRPGHAKVSPAPAWSAVRTCCKQFDRAAPRGLRWRRLDSGTAAARPARLPAPGHPPAPPAAPSPYL